jgi:hypothetical protein
MLTTLESDGGLPGKTLEERVLRTVVFALAALQSQIETGTSLYKSHLKKMAKFIETNKTVALSLNLTLVDQVVEFLKNSSMKIEGDWIENNEKLSLTPTGTVQPDHYKMLQGIC